MNTLKNIREYLQEIWYLYAVALSLIGVSMLFSGDKSWLAPIAMGLFLSSLHGAVVFLFWLAERLDKDPKKEGWFLVGSFIILLAAYALPADWPGSPLLKVVCMALALWFLMAGVNSYWAMERYPGRITPSLEFGVLITWVALFFRVMPALVPDIVMGIGAIMVLVALSGIGKTLMARLDKKLTDPQ